MTQHMTSVEMLEQRLRSAESWHAEGKHGLDPDGAPYEAADTIASMREALEDRERLLAEAALQLEYLDGRFGTGTTPAVLARIRTVLNPNKESKGD